MTVDLTRPPARLPPRLSDYVIVVIAWVIFFAIAILTGVLSNISSTRGGFLILGILTLVDLAVALYLSVRIGWRALVYSWVTDLTKYPPVGGADIRSRSADREEIEAGRLLRKGRITRVQYEQRIAYRRFVHGEITRAEYHSILAQLEVAKNTLPHK